MVLFIFHVILFKEKGNFEPKNLHSLQALFHVKGESHEKGFFFKI